MQRAVAAMLPDGRLHLQHGPIDLIIGVEGPGQALAYRRATQSFGTILEELAAELPALRSPVSDMPPVSGLVAQRMAVAVRPFAPLFVTPMAAVAGAVADEVLDVIAAVPGVRKAYVNNGGDVAFHMAPGQRIDAAIATGHAPRITITSIDPYRGLATSGWRGRSHSLGIADSVTVLARTAAGADAAATLVANAVDLPGHKGIVRRPAQQLSPDSDLAMRPVTVAVPLLDPVERGKALDNGLARADDFMRHQLIGAAYLVLQGEARQTGPAAISDAKPEVLNA